jgi:hypothetical protein
MNYLQTFQDSYFQKYEDQTFQFFLDREFAIPKNPTLSQRPIHLLILQSHHFQPLHINFIHLIKKINLHIHLFTDSSNIPSLQNEIFGDELEDHIHFYHGNPFLIETFKNKIFDMIMIHHASYFDFKFIDLLREYQSILQENGRIYFFYSVEHGSDSKLQRKNFFRQKIQQWTNLPIGNIKHTIDILDMIQSLSHLYEKIESKPFQSTYYPLFGRHQLFSYILRKIN